MAQTRRLTDDDYERLLEFRTGLRTFLTWSKNQDANTEATLEELDRIAPSLRRVWRGLD